MRVYSIVVGKAFARTKIHSRTTGHAGYANAQAGLHRQYDVQV